MAREARQGKLLYVQVNHLKAYGLGREIMFQAVFRYMLSYLALEFPK